MKRHSETLTGDRQPKRQELGRLGQGRSISAAHQPHRSPDTVAHTDHLNTTQTTKPGEPTWEMLKASGVGEKGSRGAHRHRPLRQQVQCSTMVKQHALS